MTGYRELLAQPGVTRLVASMTCARFGGGMVQLVAVLFVLGAMSLLWMAVVAAVIFVEKVLPHGPRLAPVVAVAAVALGIWVGVSPASVPGLTDPGQSPSMQMG